MKSRPIYGFGNYTDSGLNTKLALILTKMAGNASFPNPVPSLVVLQAKKDEYNDALVAAQTRAIGTAAYKNNIRAQAELMFKELAGYIMSITSDKAVIDTTGFDSTGQYGPIGNLPAPQIKITSGQSAIAIDISPIHGAANYIVEMCDVDPQLPEAKFYVVGNPTSTHFETAIPSLTYRWVRCRANGSAGEGDNSAITRCSAL